ncbi:MULTISPECIES: hypothetical protein [Rhizobium]|uniref:Uncharacterized protein n=1 Tax=Rhizobium rhododendri TaxID=2506430 RepID=A0ABY8IS14_9HYPH|nr:MULTISPECIES: hypothetical protein [Rhizobium]MBZ5759526.1 hypothetical protein [Rhizobium sp. VS19-DR96]MBZ5765741.1 hypothetical protein [Rhizobium sp. VS19-DR129.2]MBZ5773825.1 hypothetical protein [Rhizobium sp. VS19-DRK62.2]MBZ5784897.1 hypothetical protein [Rhizobium sp. VS19-DR121]MBZ5802026.1 hypothetical protein [Rhizobium sp. VS19-DR181]
MNFEYSDPQTHIEGLFGGFFHISAFGQIEEGDDEKFQRFLERVAPPPRTSVYINSGGGHLEVAIAIGRLIRGAWFSTSIGTYILDPQQPDELIIPRKFAPGKCISAATLMFLGGRLRYYPDGSKFGVHQFSFKNPSPESMERSQRLSAAIAAYIADMGIPATFLELSANTRGDQITFVSEEQLKGLKVITGGMTEATWGVEIHPEATWVRGERDSLWGHGKVILIYSKTDGFSFAALIETMGRDKELMSFPLVEIVVNGEDIRIDISDRCARAPSGIYTMFMASLVENEACLLAFSKSFGIQIRGSPQAEIFFGIAAVSTDGAEGKLQGLYKLGAT